MYIVSLQGYYVLMNFVSKGSYGADSCDYLVITPDRSLAFPSVEYVRALVSKAGVKQGCSSIPVVIDAKHIQGADFTAAKVNIKNVALKLNLREH